MDTSSTWNTHTVWEIPSFKITFLGWWVRLSRFWQRKKTQGSEWLAMTTPWFATSWYCKSFNQWLHQACLEQRWAGCCSTVQRVSGNDVPFKSSLVGGFNPCEPGSKVAILGMVIPPLIGNPYNGHINPYYWVDDHPLLYGNNGSWSTRSHIWKIVKLDHLKDRSENSTIHITYT